MWSVYLVGYQVETDKNVLFVTSAHLFQGHPNSFTTDFPNTQEYCLMDYISF